MKSMQNAFEVRSALNYCIDSGLTDEDIQNIWREAERNKVLREAGIETQ